MRSVAALAAAIAVLASAAPAAALAAGGGCVACHGDPRKMKEMGFPHFAVTPQEVEAQTRMAADCAQCHLGDPGAATKEEAHRGLARLQIVKKKALAADVTTPRKYPLQYGTNPANKLFVAAERGGKMTRDDSAVAIQWHDKRADTLTQNFDTLRRTCGACHPRELEEFEKSAMGTNAKQSQYKGFTERRRGPHNCGPWFEGNYEAIQANTAVPISAESHRINQRACNTCHVGCLDCHFDPRPSDPRDRTAGPHTFARTPPSLACYGNGRGSVCHAGPEDRRRGAGYYGGPFSFPEGNAPDVHVAANVGCLDCHKSTRTNPKLGHGTVVRQAEGSCVQCHAPAVARHAASLHRSVTCEACHIQRVAGYQGTYWGPGDIAGAATPFFKFKAYYGVMPEPILLKDQRGRWIPVKPYPMAAMNQKAAPFERGLHWRYPAALPDSQRTDDAWAYTGLHEGLPSNVKALTWIQLDKLSHKLGKARDCDSCHCDRATGAQIQKVTWDYEDPGAEPFSGEHTVVASRTGLRIEGIKAREPIVAEKGYQVSAFAPWVYLDVWEVPGDFSVPVPRDAKAYDEAKLDLRRARAMNVVH